MSPKTDETHCHELFTPTAVAFLRNTRAGQIEV